MPPPRPTAKDLRVVGQGSKYGHQGGMGRGCKEEIGLLPHPAARDMVGYQFTLLQSESKSIAVSKDVLCTGT